MEPIAEEIYALVKKKMAEQAAYDRRAYEELVEETIDYFQEKGKLTDDESDAFLKSQLMAMWEDAQDSLSDQE
jgi:polyhydroxyalkanoate synthesis regulator phasin